MASISLPPSEHHLTGGNQFTQLASVVGRHRYYLLVFLVIVVATIIALTMQSAAASTRRRLEMSTQTPVTQAIASPPTTPSSPSTVDQVSATDSGANKTQVTVNNQSIPVPTNGTVEKTIPNSGNASLNVSVDSTSSGSSQTTSSTSVHVNSSSQTNYETQEDSQ